MKKIILSLVMALVLIVATSCSLQSGDTIKFTSLPQPVYTQGYSEEAFKKEVKVSINGYETSLESAEGVVIAGLDFQTVGSHTLVVVYNSASLTFDYEVVASLTTTKVSDEGELFNALKDGVAAIELTKDIEVTEHILYILKPVIIYGNGFTVSSPNKTRIFQSYRDLEGWNIPEKSTIAFYDLTIDAQFIPSNGKDVRAVCLKNIKDCTVIFDNCNLSSIGYTLNVRDDCANTEIYIKNGSSASGWAAINCLSENCEITVMDSNLYSYNTLDDPSNSFATIVLYGPNSTINVTNSIISAEQKGAAIQNIAGIWEYEDAGITPINSTINFTNCKFNSNNPEKLFRFDSGNTIIVDGEVK